jgi:serine/threonine/tyrosine-interacting protein
MATTAPFADKASQPYVQNRLEAPRYVVPPPNLDYEGGKPVFTLINAAPHVDVSSEFGNPVFIRALVSHGAYHVKHLGLEWKYDQRRAAQTILPFLLLGPGTAAQDVNFVRTEGITLLVAVRSASAARLQARLLDPSKFASSAGLQTLTLDLDSPYDMITKLPRAIKAINDHLEQSCDSKLPTSLDDIPAKVLVFCESGNDRSAAVLTAYLMVLYGLGAVEAMQLVQSQRFCLAIEDGSKNMLQAFEDILKAKRDVAMEQNLAVRLSQIEMRERYTISGGSRRVSKRRYDTANESDDAMEDGELDEGENETEGRLGQAPFQDG